MTTPHNETKTLALPGYDGVGTRDVVLKRHTLDIGQHAFDVYDFEHSITVDHVENELRTPSLLHTLGADFEGTIVDVGANVGIYTILASKLCPKAKLVSIEPLADTFATLEENLRLNNVTSKTVQVAVSDLDQPMILSWDQRNPGSASVIHGGPELEVVGALRLPTILNNIDVPVIDLLKLDIEGLEYSVLDKLSVAEWRRIRRLSLELHGVLIFPPRVNHAIYQAMSEFLKEVALHCAVEIEVRWPNDHKPDSNLMYAWRPESFSLFFHAGLSR